MVPFRATHFGYIVLTRSQMARMSFGRSSSFEMGSPDSLKWSSQRPNLSRWLLITTVVPDLLPTKGSRRPPARAWLFKLGSRFSIPALHATKKPKTSTHKGLQASILRTRCHRIPKLAGGFAACAWLDGRVPLQEIVPSVSQPFISNFRSATCETRLGPLNLGRRSILSPKLSKKLLANVQSVAPLLRHLHNEIIAAPWIRAGTQILRSSQWGGQLAMGQNPNRLAPSEHPIQSNH